MATNRDREPSREPMNMSLSEKQKITELCMEPIEEKRTKIIESSSSYKNVATRRKSRHKKCEAYTKNKEINF